MNTNRKRIASGAVSVALVGGIVAAALTLGPAFAASPAPTSTYDVPAGEIVNVDDAISDLEAEKAAEAEAARVEAERVAAEAAAVEAARVEAERVAAEQAAAEQAARDEQARQQQQQAPAPAPAPAMHCPAGSSATESDGYNDTACMPNAAPNGGSCWEGDNGMLPECQPFRL